MTLEETNQLHLLTELAMKLQEPISEEYLKVMKHMRMKSFLNYLEVVKERNPEAYNKTLQMIDWKKFYHELYDKE